MRYIENSWCLILLVLVINISLSESVSAQEIRTKTGFGYYDPQIGGDTGNIFYTDFSIKLPTDYYLGVGYGMSDVFTKYTEVPLFKGFGKIRNYYHFRLFVDREFAMGEKKRHFFNIGTGLTYIQLRFKEPEVFVRNNTLYVSMYESNRKQDDAGFLIHASYGYRYKHLSIGVRAESHILLGVGLGGIILSPQIGINF